MTRTVQETSVHCDNQAPRRRGEIFLQKSTSPCRRDKERKKLFCKFLFLPICWVGQDKARKTRFLFLFFFAPGGRELRVNKFISYDDNNSNLYYRSLIFLYPSNYLISFSTQIIPSYLQMSIL